MVARARKSFIFDSLFGYCTVRYLVTLGFLKSLEKKFNLANLVCLFQEAQDLVFECVFVCVLDGLRLIV